jgi:beta-barrel assembly-enhancing protease
MRRTALPILLAFLTSACDVSNEEEVALGRENAEKINQAIPLVSDPRAVGYLSALGKNIAAKTARRDLEWHFAIVNAAEVNAFALPGGYIYVNRGLIERAETLDQLTGVLGHEIGHVVLRHSIEQMKKTTGANIGVTVICAVTSLCDGGLSQVAINIAGSALLARYSRGDEIEADSQAVINVVQAGFDPSGIPEFFEKLMEERGRDPSVFDTFFASHPIEESRVAYTRTLIDRYDRAQLGNLVSDDAGYQTFRRIIMSLPAPPPPRELPR